MREEGERRRREGTKEGEKEEGKKREGKRASSD